MRRSQVQSAPDLLLPLAEAAAGKSVNQIEAQVAEARILGAANRVFGVATAVRTAHPVEAVVAKALHAHAEPVESGRAPQREPVRTDVFGVDLEGAFSALRQLHTGPNGLVERQKFRVGKHTWRAAAPVQGLGRHALG